MIRINALIDVFFKDLPWEQRVAAIAGCGCRFVETWGGGNPAMLNAIHAAGRDCGVELVSIVLNGPADAQTAPVNPDNRQRFLDLVDRYADNALAAGCRQGIATTGPSVDGLSRETQRTALIDALRDAADRLADRAFQINLEPLNTAVDHAGYFLDDARETAEILQAVDRPHVRMLYDVYHMTIMGGNQTVFLEQHADRIGHLHAAGVPGRHEPFLGETHYPFLLQRLEAAGYRGFCGLEYFPTLPHADSLTQSMDYLTAGLATKKDTKAGFARNPSV